MKKKEIIMKSIRVFCIAFFSTALALLLALGASAGYYYDIGDVDGDGKITSADARLALRASVGLEKLSYEDYSFDAADADYDGEVTSADARLILRASVNLEELVDFGTLLEDEADYRIGLDHWEWGVDEDNDPYVDVYFVCQNRSAYAEEFDLYNFAVNDCMVEFSFPLNVDDDYFVLAPGACEVCTVRCYNLNPPKNYSLTPVGRITFSCWVGRLTKNGTEEYFDYIGGDIHTMSETELLEYAHYEAPYPDKSYSAKTSYCRFFHLDVVYDSWYYQNDVMTNRLFYQNISNADQYVEIELTAVNGRSAAYSAKEGNPKYYYTVYLQHSAILAMDLFYDVDDPTSQNVLNRLKIMPSQVYSLDYIIRVYDYDSDELMMEATAKTTIN